MRDREDRLLQHLVNAVDEFGRIETGGGPHIKNHVFATCRVFDAVLWGEGGAALDPPIAYRITVERLVG